MHHESTSREKTTDNWQVTFGRSDRPDIEILIAAFEEKLKEKLNRLITINREYLEVAVAVLKHSNARVEDAFRQGFNVAYANDNGAGYDEDEAVKAYLAGPEEYKRYLEENG